MRVVIDTNVVVSAAFKNKGPEEVLQFIVSRHDFEWVVSPAILAEYKEVLAREKFGLSIELRRKWEHLLDSATTLIDVPAAIEFSRDPTDAKFLACAVTANAEWLLRETGTSLTHANSSIPRFFRYHYLRSSSLRLSPNSREHTLKALPSQALA